MSIDTNNSASTRTVVDWDDAPEGATHFQPSSGLFRVDRWFKDDFTSVFVPSIGNCWIDCEDDDLGSLADVIERPKTLTQAVFDGLPIEYRWAAVDSEGRAYAHKCTPKGATAAYWLCVRGCAAYLIGGGYDTTDWQNSLIERETVNPVSEQNQPVERKHSHYFKDVSGVDQIDVYAVLRLFEVTDPCLQHIVKKALCAGKRGAKDWAKDVQEIADTANRLIELERAK